MILLVCPATVLQTPSALLAINTNTYSIDNASRNVLNSYQLDTTASATLLALMVPFTIYGNILAIYAMSVAMPALGLPTMNVRNADQITIYCKACVWNPVQLDTHPF